MKNKIIKLYLLISLTWIISYPICFSEEIVTNKDGKKILLKDDYTWEYFFEQIPEKTEKSNLSDSDLNIIKTFNEYGSFLIKDVYGAKIKYIVMNPGFIPIQFRY